MSHRYAKNVSTALMTALLLAGLFVGCGKKKSTEPETGDLTGKWEAIKETVFIGGSSTILTPESILFREMVVDFQSNGILFLTMGDSAAQQGTWVVSGTTLTMTFEDSTVITGPYTVSGDTATLDTNLPIEIVPGLGPTLTRIIFEFTRIRES